MILEKYSFGVGDRFAQEGEAQLRAIQKAASRGVEIAPVWNKSNREHQIIHSSPEQTRDAADSAVANLGWRGPYYVDADHINLQTVDVFAPHSDFFTLDVADYIGREISAEEMETFLGISTSFVGELEIPGIPEPFHITEDILQHMARSYYAAIREAAAIYRHIESIKGEGTFIAEVSMDEVESPQTPVDLFFILQLIGHFQVPAQTIAPKFTGRFNKGVDYVGDAEQFRKEFEQDLLVIDHAIKTFGLQESLKLSVHSGSDKFTLYPIMGDLIRKHNKGIHVKTAGTTWLEELIGLAMAGSEALEFAKGIYTEAYGRQEELCGPYSTVIDIVPSSLPLPAEVAGWSGEKFAATLRHVPGHPDYDSGFRQLLHVGYKVAAERGEAYLEMIKKHSSLVGEQVTTNIYDRHICRLFNL